MNRAPILAATVAACPGSAAGDGLEELIARLYQETASALLRYAMTVTRDRQLAEDALQECFLRLFVAWRDGEVINNPKPWLFRVLRNRLLNDLRRVALSPLTGAEQAPDVPDWRRNPEACLRREEIGQSLRSVLSPRELECLELRVEGLQYSEIAATLRVRPGTVGAMLARAVRKGKKVLRFSVEGAC